MVPLYITLLDYERYAGKVKCMPGMVGTLFSYEKHFFLQRQLI